MIHFAVLVAVFADWIFVDWIFVVLVVSVVIFALLRAGSIVLIGRRLMGRF